MRAMRWLPAVLALNLLLPACTEEPVEPSLRARLSPSLVALAQTLERAEGMADSARYRVERGEPMREALALVRGTLDEIRADAGELAHSAMGIRDPQVAAIARQAVELALSAADDTDGEVAALAPLVDADVLMEQAIATWAAAADAGLGERVGALSAALAAAPVAPAQCRTLWDHRVRWSALVAARTTRLTESAAERDGFLANPFGEDRRAMDANDRPCWRVHGALPRAVADLRPLMERFSELTREHDTAS